MMRRPASQRDLRGDESLGHRVNVKRTIGTVNADVLQHLDDSFVRDDFVDIIRTNSWPERYGTPPKFGLV